MSGDTQLYLQSPPFSISHLNEDSHFSSISNPILPLCLPSPAAGDHRQSPYSLHNISNTTLYPYLFLSILFSPFTSIDKLQFTLGLHLYLISLYHTIHIVPPFILLFIISVNSIFGYIYLICLAEVPYFFLLGPPAR
jgi:hypothetical protein